MFKLHILLIFSLQIVEHAKLCKKFAVKASRHPNHRKWFVETKPGRNTRSIKVPYKPPLCRLTRTKKGPIPYLTNLLNSK